MFCELIKNIHATEDDGYMMAPKVENTTSNHPQSAHVQKLYSKPHATPTCALIEPVGSIQAVNDPSLGYSL